jgi:arabinan endo-1,5-alpha-L-arabinosidase
MKTHVFGKTARITAVIAVVVLGLGTGNGVFGEDTPATTGDAVQPPAPDLSRGLVLYFPFDAVTEEAGLTKVADQSGNGNVGVLTGGALVEGKFGKALECNAKTEKDGVIVNDSNSLDLDAVTIAAWIKTSRLDDQWNRILDKGWQSAYNLCIGGEYKGQRYQEKTTFECAGCSMTSKTSVVDGQWHLIVGSYDGQFQKLYIDGKLDNKWKMKKRVPMKHNDNVLTIGRLAVMEVPPYDKPFFDGLIDEVRLYNRVLSDEEVQMLSQYQPVN